MLRAAVSVCAEGPRELLAAQRRDVFRLFRAAARGAPAAPEPRAHSTDAAPAQTVLTASQSAAPPPPPPPAPPRPRPRAPPPPPPPRRSWTAATALALTASIGGVYFYRKMNDSDKDPAESKEPAPAQAAREREEEDEEEGEVYPDSGAALPERVDYLVVGGGTAAFAALRALRAARPRARLLLVGAERAPPYMRPPLSKELWRDPALAAAAADPLRLAFTQWNGKRRSLIYEPLSFYTPVEALRDGAAGAGLARGWRVTRLDVAARSATLEAPGGRAAAVRFDQCLLATGSAPRRLAALAPAAAAGRAVPLHSVRDAARLARLLDAPATRRVAVVGGGLLASELAAALADRLRGTGKTVVQVYRERALLEELLPHYLAADAARRLRDAGVELLPESEVSSSALREGRVVLRLQRAGAENEPSELAADVVVECVGAAPADALAAAAGLELDAQRGGVLVNAELQARSGVWAAGDVASFHDAALGRRRVAHHDHAVLSARRAAANMAAAAAAGAQGADDERDPPPTVEPYTHQSMFWSDMGPELGLEAIGIIDNSLPTVGVFSTDAVSEAGAARARAADADNPAGGDAADAADAGPAPPAPAALAVVAAESAGAGGAGGAGGARRYERGVVFYLRERRVVGVLLWNLFNRMHVARQVLEQGEFDDLLEVAKLFAPHDPE